MTLEIIIDRFGCGNAVVVRQKGKLINFFIDPPKDFSSFYPPSTFMWATIQRKIKRNGGYFIGLPNGNNGFLITKKNYSEGCSIKVVSNVFYEPGKPQRFSDKLKMVSKYFIIDEGRGDIICSKKIVKKAIPKQFKELLGDKQLTVILRSSLLGLNHLKAIRKFKETINEYFLMTEAMERNKVFYGGLAKKVALETFDQENCKIIERDGIFEALGVWDQLMEVSASKMPFGKGSFIFIEQTKAFCSIDVNSGGDFKSSVEKININACDTINLLIRQRGIGGKIIIDFLPCSKEIKKKILIKLKEFFSIDSQKNIVWGWTKSGAFEIEREREKSPIDILINW